MRADLCRSLSLLVLVLLAAAAVPAAAQEHPNVARGINPAASFDLTGVDNVNQFNGNLVITLPLGQSFPAGGGLSYQLTLVYNSQVWTRQEYGSFVQSIPVPTDNAGLGWMVSLGRFNPPEYRGDFDPNLDTYMSPDGSRHTFYPTLHEGETATAGIEYSRDGSYLRYTVASRQLELPDGTVHTFDLNGFPTRIGDRFGNHVDICYGTQCGAPAGGWQITDGQGRVHNVYFKTLAGTSYQSQVVDRIELAGFKSQRPAYTFHYNVDDGIATVVTGCANSDPATNNLSVALLTSVTLPDGTAWSMPAGDYLPTSSTLTCTSGLLHKLTLPTLGKIAWDYIGYTYPTGSTTRGYWRSVTGVGTRKLLDADNTELGTWTYTTSLNGKTELTNTLTDPQGTRTTRYFSVCASSCDSAQRYYEYGLAMTRDKAGDGTGRFLSAQTASGGNQTLRTSYVRYEHDLESSGGPTLQDMTRSNQRVAAQRTVFDDDGGLVADEASSDFDGHGHYRGHTSSGNFPGSTARTSSTGYNPGRGTYGQQGYSPWPLGSPWILGTYTYHWDAENGQLLFRSFCFDPNTGFLLGRRVHGANDASYRTNDLIEVFSNDASGNLVTESSFGGDTQAVSADPIQGFICTQAATLTGPLYQVSHTYTGGALATTATMVGGTALFTLDQTLDSKTGLPISSRDTAGVATTYSYDGLGRPLSVQPAQGAATTYSYHNAVSRTNPATVTVTRTPGVGAAVQSRVTYDTLGRATLEEELMPDGSWSQKRTNFNAQGWKTFVSSPGTPNAGTSFPSFDPFGRPLTVRPADGSTHDVTLSYAGTRQVARTSRVATSATGESYATTLEVYDRFGRLYQVTEPNNTVTRYDYDAGNHLAHVCQGVTATGACTQERRFTYDNRGLLLWESHPEKGANALGQGHGVDYPVYDARGHALRRVDGANDLTFVFDAAERLTLVRESGTLFTDCVSNGGHRCLKSFTYAAMNGTNPDNSTEPKKGKLVAASRYNYVGTPFNATVEIRETSTYNGLLGRLSQKDTAQIFNGSQSEVFRQTFTWNDLGNLDHQTYPDCIAPTVCGASSPRTVSYGYGSGRLTAIPGFVTAITYQPSGLFSTVSHANGVTDFQSPDPNGIPRPAALSAKRDSDSVGLWSSGTYQYDGSGNVWKMGAATYLYDLLSRVTSGTVYPGAFTNGTAHTQTSTYDAYGNLTALTTNGVQLNAPTSVATNRLTAGAYDAAGNLTGWSGNVYEYDAFNQMTRMVSGAEDWRYLYTADDERFWSYRVGGNGSLWTLRDLNGKVLRDYQAHLGWSVYRDYVHRDGILLAVAASPGAGGAVNHLHVDHLGTPRLITDATGNPATAQFHTYYPFGQEIAGTYTTAYTDPFRFTGHERDLANIAGQSDDLDYMHARHYGPLFGRFLSVDPTLSVKSAAPDPKAWNRYSYVLNDSSSKTDPTGRCIEDFCIGEAIVAGIALAETPAGQELIEGGEAESGAALQEVAAAATEISEATARSLRSLELGRIGERVLGSLGQAKERIASLTGKADFRIPDLLHKVSRQLIDSKNVARLSYSSQIRDFVLWAQQNGYQVTLQIRSTTVLSKALQALINSGLIKIIYIQ